MTDEDQDAPAAEAEPPDGAGDDEALDVSALMEEGGETEAGDPDAPGVISAEALLEDPGAPETRAPEEIATGEARAKAAAEAGAAAATGQPAPPQQEANAEIDAAGSAVSEGDEGSAEPVPEAQSPDALEQSPDAEAPVEAEAEAAPEPEPEPEPEQEAPAEPEAEAPAAEAPADDGGDDDDEPQIDPAVQEFIGGEDTTVVHHASGKDEHGLPTEFRTPPGISGGIDPGTLADRDRKV